MGAVCCGDNKTEQSGVTAGNTKPTDLPEPSLLMKDVYQSFELTLPFARTSINVFFQLLDKALDKTEPESPKLTIAGLQAAFESPAW